MSTSPGNRRWGIIVLLIIDYFLTPLGSTLGIMMLLRILVGVGQGLLVPANFSLAARWVPKSESGKATGLLQVGCPAGIAFAMVLAAWIIQTWGWKSVFYIVSVPGLVWCLLWWWLGNSRPQMDNRINRQELAYIQAGQAVANAEPSAQKETAGGDLTKADIPSTPYLGLRVVLLLYELSVFSLYDLVADLFRDGTRYRS